MHENIERRAGLNSHIFAKLRIMFLWRCIIIAMFVIWCLGAGAALSATDEQGRKPDSLRRDTTAPKGESVAEEQRLTEDEALAISTRYLEAHKAEYGLTDLAKDLSEPKVRTSRHMSAAVMYMQLYKGIPVVPGGIVVHIWKSSVEKVSDHLLKDIDLDSTGAITKEQALDIAIQKFESLCDSAEVYKTELLITNDPRDDRIRLTWSVVLRCLAKLEARGYNIDAFTGEIFAESDGKKR